MTSYSLFPLPLAFQSDRIVRCELQRVIVSLISRQKLTKTGEVVVARGQCIEQYGAGEAFLPILDALEQLCRAADGEATIASLRKLAPSWLIDLPALISPQERETLARQCLGVTPERRWREITAFFEELAKNRTVEVILEDLQWVDPSTLALISFLARRREAARLLLIGTCRGGEVERFNLPLKTVAAELEMHNLCVQLPLKLLSRSAVEEYLAARFQNPAVSSSVVSTVYDRSEGNPLFMVNVTDYLVDREAVVQENGSVELANESDENTAPSTIRELIERQLEALPAADQELLKTASVAGLNFSTAAVAAALEVSIEQIEIRCDRLAKQEQFLQREGMNRWPDGTVGARYGFAHALYQNVIYESVLASRKARLHLSVGERTEAVYQGATDQVAAELALHFERAGDFERTMKYMLQAAQRSFSVGAYAETIEDATKALALAESLPATTLRSEIELNLQLLVAAAICASQGYAANETREAFARGRELSRNVSDDALSFQSLAGIWSFYLLHGELRTALSQARELLALARRTQHQGFLLNAHMAMVLSLFYQGQFQPAHNHLEQALPHYDFEYHRSTISLFGWDPGVVVYCYDAQALWFLGFPERAEKAAEQAIALVKKLSSPFNEALCYAIHATYSSYRRDATKALEMAETALKISDERGFLHWIALGRFNKGWSLCSLGSVNEGLPILLDGMKMWKAMGAEMAVPTFQVLLGEIYQTAGKPTKALAAVEDGLAIAARNNDCHYDAELYRPKGELLLKKSGPNSINNSNEAEACFRLAIDIARKQKARMLELRAANGLARLWQTPGKKREAYQALAKVYRWFTEGSDTPDLKEARSLLDKLG